MKIRCERCSVVLWPQMPQGSGPIGHFVNFGLHLKLHSINAVINLSVDGSWKLQITFGCNLKCDFVSPTEVSHS